jgi:hypothetical protein
MTDKLEQHSKSMTALINKFNNLSEKGLTLTEKVRNGDMDDKIVYVCHFNKPDMDKKPLRNVPPTKCVVSSNSKLPTNKKIYYSESHYSPLSAKDVITKKIIAPQDNTGFRSSIGNSLYTFHNYEDCSSLWNMQLSEYIGRIDKRLSSFAETLNEEKVKLREMQIF